MKRLVIAIIVVVGLLPVAGCVHQQLPPPRPAPELQKIPEIRVEPCPAVNAPPAPDSALVAIAGEIDAAVEAVDAGLPAPDPKPAIAALRHDLTNLILDNEMVRSLFAVLGNRPSRAPAPPAP